MRRTVDVFRPGAQFPAVSVTGAECDLGCRHCAGCYLLGMDSVRDPDGLVRFAHSLDQAGGAGLLLSGGCDRAGKVPLARFKRAIRQIKDDTDLRLNAHVGLSPRADLEELVSAGIDVFSVDLYGSDKAVQETLGLPARARDFFKVYMDLKDLQAPRVAPHICIGIEAGRVVGEMVAVSELEDSPPAILVFIIFTPTKGTEYAACTPPPTEGVLGVVRTAREVLPDTRLMLGCMRPRKARGYEIGLLDAGIDGIVLPSGKTVEHLRSSGVEMRERQTCCALG